VLCIIYGGAVARITNNNTSIVVNRELRLQVAVRVNALKRYHPTEM